MAERDERGLQKEFWNEAGGRMWVANIERTHALIGTLGDAIVERAAPGAGEHILDVGCGGGLNTVTLGERVGDEGRVVGVDVSEMILEWARAQPGKPDNVEYLCADAGADDLGDACFDLIFSRFGVMFFDDPVAAFVNLRRSMKDDGRLAVLCWQRPDQNAWLSVPMGAIFELHPPQGGPADPRAPGPFAFADPAYVREILEAAGFADVALESLELDISMGAVDEAVEYMMHFGPAVEALEAASDADRALVAERIRVAFAPFVRDGQVVAPTATWSVTARKG